MVIRALRTIRPAKTAEGVLRALRARKANGRGFPPLDFNVYRTRIEPDLP